MPLSNQKMASILAEMADLLQLLGVDSFRVNAFSKAARVLADLPMSLESIGPDKKKLMELEGVGKGMADRIAEFLTTGKVKEHDELIAKIPPGVPELLKIPGLGPKTIALLWKEAKVVDMATLKEKLESGKLTELPGMGDKKVENILKNLAFASTSNERRRIGEAMPIALGFQASLKKQKAVEEISYAGSLRRGRETIGDVDLLVAAAEKSTESIMKAFSENGQVAEVIAHGPTKMSVRTLDHLQVDLRIVEPKSYGAALMYFTGSKEHNVLLRQRAIDRGMKLNEYGLYKKDKIVAAATEEDIYKALGLAWIPPELREANGEIELAEKNKLPKLLEKKDIRAELHAHTTASDGKMSIDELIELAISKNYHTIAITDHSKSQPIANGLSEKRLETHIVNIRKAAKKYSKQIAVLAGSEVDILPDGKLDYPNSLLKELDVVVASPHTSLSQTPEVATKRLLRAIENPFVTILGHPTGRLVNRREGLSPDMAQIIAAAKKRGIALEINANSQRLDLRDTHARMVIDAGVKLSINTDTHNPSDMDELIYGVLTARRAGATKKDIVNAFSRDELKNWIESTRK